MKKHKLLALGICIVGLKAAIADTPAALDGSVHAIKPARLTCENFLSFDEMTRPKIVYWSEGLLHKDHPEDAVFDLDMTSRLVPFLVEECTKRPRASLWKTMKATLKRSA
jgi:acid stress chaperone HdeA